MTEKQWAKATEKQRIAAKLWSRREWASVKPELRGTTRETAKLAVKKTLGNDMYPPAREYADLHCYRITDRQGRVVKFSLKLCVDGKLRKDIE